MSLQGYSTQALAAVPTAVGAARRYVRSELTKAKLAALVDDAELVASELVTNAITATGLMAPAPTWPELEGLAVIRIRLGFSSTIVLVEVWRSMPSKRCMAKPEGMKPSEMTVRPARRFGSISDTTW